MHHTVSVLFFLLLVVSTMVEPLEADVLTFKDGKEIKGEILSETSDSVLIEFNVTPTIKDQKSFSRERIAHIVSTPADEKAFQSIGSLATPDTVLDSAFYDQLIDKKIPEFLHRYPYSKHLSGLRESLRSLNADRTRFRRGDRRINGVWITAEQIEANPYQSGAKIKYAAMIELAKANDCTGSLQSFELLEKEFPGSEIMSDAIMLAQSQLDQFQGRLSLAKINFEIFEKRRQQAILLTPADQAREINNALQNEKVAASNSMATATADGSKFFPIFQNSKDSMDALQMLITAEKTRLTTLQKIPMTEGMAAANECARLASEGKLKEAQDQLTQSQSLWPANIENARLKLQLENLTKSQSAAAAAAAAAPQKPLPSPTSVAPVKP
jgi:hypothetical protein